MDVKPNYDLLLQSPLWERAVKLVDALEGHWVLVGPTFDIPRWFEEDAPGHRLYSEDMRLAIDKYHSPMLDIMRAYTARQEAEWEATDATPEDEGYFMPVGNDAA